MRECFIDLVWRGRYRGLMFCSSIVLVGNFRNIIYSELVKIINFVPKKKIELFTYMDYLHFLGNKLELC